jgi:hypothetical protein
VPIMNFSSEKCMNLPVNEQRFYVRNLIPYYILWSVHWCFQLIWNHESPQFSIVHKLQSADKIDN